MLVRPDAPAAKTVGVRVWPKAIPQFNVAHLNTVQARRPRSPARLCLVFTSMSGGAAPEGACGEGRLRRLWPAASRFRHFFVGSSKEWPRAGDEVLTYMPCASCTESLSHKRVSCGRGSCARHAIIVTCGEPAAPRPRAWSWGMCASADPRACSHEACAPPLTRGRASPWQGAKEELVEAGWGGLMLGGNYVAGVALGKCVEYAYTFAAEVATYLRTQAPTAGPEPAAAGADEGFFV